MNTISKDIDEDVLRSFIWAVHNFFTISTKKEPEIEVPFLYEGMYHLDYTGAIGVSGNHKGAIYLTLGEDIVDRLFTNHQKRYFSNQETSVEELKEQKLDYTGEIINIISGNVRNYLGENFLISVPIVINAPKTPLYLNQKGCGIVFPITWEGMKCSLILNLAVGLEQAADVIQSLANE